MRIITLSDVYQPFWNLETLERDVALTLGYADFLKVLIK